MTPITGSLPRIAVVLGFGGELHAQVFDQLGNPTQTSFAFVVHRG